MGLLSFFDEIVLKLSGLVSSTYMTIVIANALLFGKNERLNKQALGFLALFFISLLIYLVV